jgi:hypothetical protein
MFKNIERNAKVEITYESEVVSCTVIEKLRDDLIAVNIDGKKQFFYDWEIENIKVKAGV